VTYPEGVSPNPNAVAGAQSDQTSPPKYPSPWGSGDGDWAKAYEKARDVVKQLTLEEKVNLITGMLITPIILLNKYLQKQALDGNRNNVLARPAACLVWALEDNVFKIPHSA
jgi:hypothetical protein